MNETLALIISGVSVAGGLGSFLFFQNKTKKDLIGKTNKIYELETTLNKLKSFSKEEILKVTNENNSLKSENEQIKEQLSISKAEVFSLQEENELRISNENERNSAQLIEILDKIDSEENTEYFNNSSEPISILFVDDSPVIRVTIKKLLNSENYELTLANDGMEALNIINEKRFDLIITDLEMPNLDGFGLMAKLSESVETKDIPIIVLTGHDDVSVKIDDANSLMGLYKKPWNETELLNRIKLLSYLKSQVNK
jgi:CheY-like chemotaxis protein